MPQIKNPIVYLANRYGIPRLESQSVAVNGTTNVIYSFNSDISFSRNFSGILVVKLSQAIPAGTTGTLPIMFTSPNGGTFPLLTYGGAPVTASEITGTGIRLVYYENGTLQLL